ncbi:MAG: DNA cytosine methyltransferase [Thermoleophilia bacterium]|nr:DNA cytosine methyltransferase [Thermoleophilia bacterium]
MRTNQRLSFIDLFSGAGGLAEGFRQAGFKSVFAVEHDQAAAGTYRANFHHDVFVGPIEKLKTLPTTADIIVGGPPCQGFSPLGKMSPTANHLKLNKLWKHYFRIVSEVSPRAFVIENVPEILKSQEFIILKRTAHKLGYKIQSKILYAVDYGVPQGRRRAFIIGCKEGEPSFPEPTGEFRTVKDAIGDLPLIPDGENWHIGRNPTSKSLERYKCIPPGGNRFDLMRLRPDIAPDCWLNKPTGSTDVFGRLEWDKPSLTIRTEFFKPEKGCYLHPKAQRPITHREAARLQTFPDDYIFCGSKTEVAKQIGNAVPPKLAYHVALSLKATLSPARKTKASRKRPIKQESYA